MDTKNKSFATSKGKTSGNGRKTKLKAEIEVTKTGWSTTAEHDGIIDLDFLINLPVFAESRDEGGNSVQISVRVPEYLARVITSLKESKAAPYKVNSDVVRDSVYLGLFVQTCRYGGINAMLLESRLAQATDVAGEAQRLQMKFNVFVDNLSFLVEHDDAIKAKEIFIDYVKQIPNEERLWTKNKMISLILNNHTTKSMLQTCDDKIKKIVSLK